MAIIYSYQENEDLLNSDMLVGTATTLHNGKVRKITKNFTLGQLKTFISTGGLILSNGGTSGPATLIDNILNIPVYQGQITLTTTGSSGAATLIGNTLNIPNYTTSTPTLQQVTTAGNTTSNSVIVSNGAGSLITVSNNGIFFQTSTSHGVIFSNSGFSLVDDLTTQQFSLDFDGLYLKTISGGSGGRIKADLLTSTQRTYQLPDASGTLALTSDIPASVTSVGLSMPSAFTVSNSPITSSGTIAVTGAGTVSQYVRGDGTLANFPNSTGGGASVNYYLNGSVSQGTFGGTTYYQMSKTPILGAGTNFIRTNGAGNGYIASFLTDAGDPSFLNIPGGNWNLELYFQSSASGGSPQFYGEIYKVSATNVFTLVASGSANPEGITNGTTVDQYFTSIPMPQTSLLITDRLAIRIYVITGGRTITLHTENGNLCEVLTTFTTGLTALNGLTTQVQYFAVGTSGTDFNISSATDTHTFNLPTASATNRGALSSADWSAFNGKFTLPSLTSGSVIFSNGTTLSQDNTNFFWDDTNNRLGIGTNTPTTELDVNGVIRGLLPDPTGVGGITAKLLSYSPSPYGLVFRGYTSGAHSIQSQREANDAQMYPLVLQPNGSNVGIRTLTPATELDVNGVITATGGNSTSWNAKQNALLDIAGVQDNGIYSTFMNGAISYFLGGLGAATFNNLRINSNFNLSGNTAYFSNTAVQFSTTATAGTLAWQRGVPFYHSGRSLLRFQPNIVSSDARYFVGLSNLYQLTNPTNVDPTTLTQTIGIAKLSTSANLFIIHNDGTGTATSFDLGVNYPATSNLYIYDIKITSTSAGVYTGVTVRRTTVSTGATISTNYTVPSNYPSVGINPALWITNNATAAANSLYHFGAIGYNTTI